MAKLTRIEADKWLRAAICREIGKLNAQIITTAPGEPRKPIYASIRVLKKLLGRADKMLGK